MHVIPSAGDRLLQWCRVCVCVCVCVCVWLNINLSLKPYIFAQSNPDALHTQTSIQGFTATREPGSPDSGSQVAWAGACERHCCSHSFIDQTCSLCSVVQPPSLSSCSTLSSPQKETLNSVSHHSPLPLKGWRLHAGPGLHPSAVVSHPLEPSGDQTKHFSLQGFPPHQPLSWGSPSPPLLQRAFLCPTLCQSHLPLSLLRTPIRLD